MKQEVLCKSTLHYPTGSELLTHDHNPDLNRSISEYEFRVIAPPTDQCEHYVVVTLSNWNKIAHATSERLLEQIYESVCNNSDGATYWQQEVTIVLQISFDFHTMFTAWCAIDSVDRNEQLAGRDPRQRDGRRKWSVCPCRSAPNARDAETCAWSSTALSPTATGYDMLVAHELRVLGPVSATT